jgi:flagellar biogenesis protein FliO
MVLQVASPVAAVFTATVSQLFPRLLLVAAICTAVAWLLSRLFKLQLRYFRSES